MYMINLCVGGNFVCEHLLCMQGKAGQALQKGGPVYVIYKVNALPLIINCVFVV